MTGAAERSADTCYRHPGRQSFILCQRCGRTICPECQTQAPVGVQCPECVAEARKASPDVRRAQRSNSALGRVLRPGGTTPVVTWAIAGACAVVALLQLVLGWWFTALVVYVPELTFAQPWRLVTSMFAHAPISLASPTSALHILFNMYALLLIGPILEQLLGRGRYLALYLLAGLGGSAAVAVLAPSMIVLGASGAIFGLFSAYFVVMRGIGRNPTQILIVIGINLVIGFLLPNVSWQAHVGGLLVGAAVAGLYMATRHRSRVWMRRAGLAGIAIVLLVVLAVAVLAGR